jgi:hypothetical protein
MLRRLLGRWFGGSGSGPWERLRDEREVARVLGEALPPGTGVHQVRAFARSRGLECSELVDGKVYCSAPATSPYRFVAARWLIVFSFTGGRLADTEVTRGLTGP